MVAASGTERTLMTQNPRVETVAESLERLRYRGVRLNQYIQISCRAQRIPWRAIWLGNHSNNIVPNADGD